MALGTMTIEYPVNRTGLCFQDEERILVWTLRFQTLPASVAQATLSSIDVVTKCLQVLVGKRRPAHICVRTNAHLATISIDKIENSFWVQPSNHASLGLCKVDVYISTSLPNAETTASPVHRLAATNSHDL